MCWFLSKIGSFQALCEEKTISKIGKNWDTSTFDALQRQFFTNSSRYLFAGNTRINSHLSPNSKILRDELVKNCFLINFFLSKKTRFFGKNKQSEKRCKQSEKSNLRLQAIWETDFEIACNLRKIKKNFNVLNLLMNMQLL